MLLTLRKNLCLNKACGPFWLVSPFCHRTEITMFFDLSVTRPLHLHDVALPYDTIFECTRGTHSICTVGRLPFSHINRCIFIPLNTRLEYHLAPDAGGGASASVQVMCEHPISPSINESDWHELNAAFNSRSGSMALAITRKVFLYPNELWLLQATADAIGVAVRALQTRLFRGTPHSRKFCHNSAGRAPCSNSSTAKRAKEISRTRPVLRVATSARDIRRGAIRACYLC